MAAAGVNVTARVVDQLTLRLRCMLRHDYRLLARHQVGSHAYELHVCCLCKHGLLKQEVIR